MTVSDDGWKRLAPASFLVNLVPALGAALWQAWPLIVFAWFGRAGLASSLLVMGLIFVTGAARTLVGVATLRYRVAPGRLEIQSGLLSRHHRVLDPDRVQDVEIVQNVFHRIAGLVEVRIETAAGVDGVEGLLSALTLEDAGAVQRALRAGVPDTSPGGSTTPTETARPDVLVATNWTEVLAFGGSELRTGAALAVLFGLWELSTVLNPRAPVLDARGTLGVALVAMGLGWGLGVGNALLRHAGFRLTRTPDGIDLASGWFTRRVLHVPLRRIQAACVEETAIRRALGYASVRIETAATGLPGEERPGEGFVPMLLREDVPQVLDALLRGPGSGWRAVGVAGDGVVVETPGFVPLAGPLAPSRGPPVLAAPPLRARVRAALPVRLALVAGTVAGMLGQVWPLVALAPAVVVGWLDGRAQGWSLEAGHGPSMLVIRKGWLTRRTWYVPVARLQSVHLVEGPLQRRLGLATVHAWIAGVGVVTPELDHAVARALADALAQGTSGFRAAGGAPGTLPPRPGGTTNGGARG